MKTCTLLDRIMKILKLNLEFLLFRFVLFVLFYFKNLNANVYIPEQ